MSEFETQISSGSGQPAAAGVVESLADPASWARRATFAELDLAADELLVAASVEGRREAFDVLVGRHQRRVYRVCYRFAGGHEDASELAQETFLRAYRGLRSFRGSSAVSTWLHRIAVNVCLERARRRPRTCELTDAELNRHAIDADLDERLDLAGQRREMRAAIDRLPTRQRAAVLLRVYEGLSHKEIAGRLGSSVGAVKANYCYAMKALRRMLTAGDVG